MAIQPKPGETPGPPPEPVPKGDSGPGDALTRAGTTSGQGGNPGDENLEASDPREAGVGGAGVGVDDLSGGGVHDPPSTASCTDPSTRGKASCQGDTTP